MKKIIFLLAIIVYSCSEKPKASETEMVVEGYIADSFLAKFEHIELDSLKIYSGGDMESDEYEFKGKPLETRDGSYIRSYFTKGDMAYDSSILNQFYACYKFDLSENRYGLIIRCPSEYESSSVRLFEYDMITQEATELMELSESWGDAGDWMEKQSLAFRDSINRLNVFHFHSIGYDHSVEDITDTTVDVSDNYYLIRPKLNGNDTFERNSEFLKSKWKGMSDLKIGR